MKYFLAIILFPIHWILLFIVRVIYYDIFWGIINLIINLFSGFFSFLTYLVLLPFWIVIDTIIAIIFTCIDSYHMSKSIIVKDKPASYYFKKQDHSLNARRKNKEKEKNEVM